MKAGSFDRLCSRRRGTGGNRIGDAHFHRRPDVLSRCGAPFFDGETEARINGRILAAGAYFGVASDRLVERLLHEQLADGGWNCEAPPSKRSSFHSTICVLEGLLEYEIARGPTLAVSHARAWGEDYLLERSMLRSLTSG